MCKATSVVKGDHFTGYIYTVLRSHISNQINHQSFYQILQKCGNSAARLDKLLTFNQLPELMSDPLTSWWAWPASQCQVPVRRHRGERSESSTLGASGPAGLVLMEVVVSVTRLKVMRIQYQERSHQHRLQHLQRQITQRLQQQQGHL